MTTTTGTGLTGPAHAAGVIAPPVAAVEVDDLDYALLSALASDARRSQRALARAVGVSPPAVAGRMARLERAGVIRGYRADINWAALGCPMVVHLAVSVRSGPGLAPVVRAIGALPEVQDMSVVTGGPDLLVRLRVSDHAHLRSLLLDTIFAIPGVQHTEAFLSLGEVERADFAAVLLERLARPGHPGGERGREHGGGHPAVADPAVSTGAAGTVGLRPGQGEPPGRQARDRRR